MQTLVCVVLLAVSCFHIPLASRLITETLMGNLGSWEHILQKSDLFLLIVWCVAAESRVLQYFVEMTDLIGWIFQGVVFIKSVISNM